MIYLIHSTKAEHWLLIRAAFPVNGEERTETKSKEVSVL